MIVPSAARSSWRLAIGSPLAAIYAAVKGTPAADCGYTSTPCGVGLLSPLNKIAVKSLIFTDILVSCLKTINYIYFIITTYFVY